MKQFLTRGARASLEESNGLGLRKQLPAPGPRGVETNED